MARVAVLFANARVTVDVRKHPARRDARGAPIVDENAETRGPFAANAREQADLSWTLRIDPDAAPLRADDVVREVGGQGRVWVLTGNPRLQALPGGPSDVDYISANAVLDPPKVP